jgi:hypothetical protein
MAMFADDADRLNEFRKQISQEDRHCMKSILIKSRIAAEMRCDIGVKLTREEKAWTANFAWKTFLWGFAEKPLIE